MKQKILVVSDNFIKGGLETQIFTTFKALKDKADFVFAFANYGGEWDFEGVPVETGFNFKANMTVEEFIHDVDKLVEVIRKYKVTAIHAHPFYSLYIAAFASQIAGVPLFYTYHGFVSLNFNSGFNYMSILNFTLNELMSNVFFVYKDIADNIVKEYRDLNTTYLPNALDFKEYPKLEVVNNREWAFITRVSRDKLDGIFAVLDNLKFFGIKKLHFYGDDECKKEVEEYASKLGIDENVFFHGHFYDLKDELDGKYNGIFGMGRVALEGLAYRMPVVMVGYGKIVGIIDKTTFPKIKNDNFAPIFCDSADIETVRKQIERVHEEKYISDVYDDLKNEFDYKMVGEKYLNVLANSKFSSRAVIRYFYEDLKKSKNKNVEFAFSGEVTALIHKYLLPQNLDKSLSMFACSQKRISDLEEEIYLLNSEIERLSTEVDNKIKESLKNVGVRTVVKNTLKSIKNKIFKK